MSIIEYWTVVISWKTPNIDALIFYQFPTHCRTFVSFLFFFFDMVFGWVVRTHEHISHILSVTTFGGLPMNFNSETKTIQIIFSFRFVCDLALSHFTCVTLPSMSTVVYRKVSKHLTRHQKINWYLQWILLTFRPT